ncbi:flavin reductase family protein [Prescottella defluvii]|uniref:flavin reductase family protein n=1 Tax=Prescottella defluvii TaxID=1323361 RepID=UPI000AA5BEDC|nr:flavin reductase family protein [Prescottella defluvii]
MMQPSNSPMDKEASSDTIVQDGGRALRDVLGHFASGVVIVTGTVSGKPVGLTCQSFSSLSINPPMVMFCPSSTSSSWGQIKASGAFCINVLEESQREVSNLFAQRRDDKFDTIDWRAGETGSPLIEGSLAHIDCTVESVFPGGDHDIVLGRVVDTERRPSGRPLLYYCGQYEILSR